MRILVITENIGKIAPGIVFERLIHGLSVDNGVCVATANYEPSIEFSMLNNVKVIKKPKIHQRLFRILSILFIINPVDWYWSKNAIKQINKIGFNNFDVILSLVSFQHYCGLIAGKIYAKKKKIRHAVYFVDAIPAPGWLKDKRYYNAILKFVKGQLNDVDFFFSSNEQMLEFQMKTFVPKRGIKSGVLYNPSFGGFKSFPITNTNTSNFVYAGGIYGARKAKYILKGFENLLKIYPNSKLQFIGSKISDVLLFSLEQNTLAKIEILPFASDLNPFYQNATALLDIDAELENDVFMSSKMSNYIMINRIIVSETGMNSPSRYLFKGISSVLQCEHDAEQLCEAMKQAIEMRDSINFNDRCVVIDLFKIENIIEKFVQTLNNQQDEI